MNKQAALSEHQNKNHQSINTFPYPEKCRSKVQSILMNSQTSNIRQNPNGTAPRRARARHHFRFLHPAWVCPFSPIKNPVTATGTGPRRQIENPR